METQNTDSTINSEAEELRKLLCKTEQGAETEIDRLLDEGDLHAYARHLAVIALQQSDKDITVLAGLLGRIRDAVELADSRPRRMQVVNTIDELNRRLYSWSYTGECAASDFTYAASKKADEILDLEPA